MKKITKFLLLILCINMPNFLGAQFITPDSLGTEKAIGAQTQEMLDFVVKGIKADVLDPKERNVRISWHPPAEKGEYIIARSTVPISTLDLMLMAESVAVVSADQSFYLDKNLRPGKFFYAIASKSQISQRKLFLYADENFTNHPVYISGESSSSSALSAEQKKAPPQVSLIYAQLIEPEAVRISWKGVNYPAVTYIVYRDIQPITDARRVDSAIRIAVITDGSEFFVDRTLMQNGTYYYGVTARSSDGAEDKNLTANQSFTQTGIVFNRTDIPVARYLQAVIFDPNSVKITWNDASFSQYGQYSYMLYRSDRMISGEQDLQSAKIIAQVPIGVQNFHDKNLPAGTYFYALVSRDSMGKTSKTFLASQNVTTMPVTIQGLQQASEFIPEQPYMPEPMPYIALPTVPEFEDKGEVFSSIKSFLRKDIILLSWRISKKYQTIGQKSKIRIYRFERQPITLRDIVEGEMIARVPVTESLYEDLPVKNGNYHYALFVETSKGLAPNDFIQGENVTGPVFFTLIEKEIEPSLEKGLIYANEEKSHKIKEIKEKIKTSVDSDSDINKTIQETYLNAEYNEAIIQLKKYEKHPKEEIRAKALFYLGLSHYQLSKYESALDYLVNPLVVKAYKQRAKFWYERILEHIK
ncbi:MAG: hypothetical protein OEZ22_11335 [Spirochaetia bacterium]|nr:hypothetical protein [Spirochaetia bacterium]